MLGAWYRTEQRKADIARKAAESGMRRNYSAIIRIIMVYVVYIDYSIDYILFSSSGGWGKIKLKPTTLPRIFFHTRRVLI